MPSGAPVRVPSSFKGCSTGATLVRLDDITVERNAFGRQVNSFEMDLTAPFLENGWDVPYHAVFIRASFSGRKR